MLFIGDPNDATGNGMFSKQGRKLNQFFINLSRRDDPTSNQFLNEISQVKDLKNTFKIKNSPYITTILREAKKKSTHQPFKLYKGRDYYEFLESQKKSTGKFADYLTSIPKPKVKILRNYNFEKPSDSYNRDKLLKENQSNVEQNPMCARLKTTAKSEKLLFKKMLGFVEFDRQTNRPQFIVPKKDYENDLESLKAFEKTRLDFSKSFIDFSKTMGRLSQTKEISLQRNNYALNPKRDLIEPRSGKIVPDFAKVLNRKTTSPLPVCQNKGFYDFEKMMKHISSPNFELRCPQKFRSKSQCISKQSQENPKKTELN